MAQRPHHQPDHGIIALSIVVITGYAGQVSLAQLTIAGVAGFLFGPISDNLHIPFPFAPILAALGAAALGVVIGLPALRIRGLTVAVVTFALAFAVEAIWFRNLDFVSSSGVAIPDPTDLRMEHRHRFRARLPPLRFGIMCWSC